MKTLERTLAPEPGRVFFAMPYGTKPTRDGEMFDFDDLYEKVFVRAVHQCDMVEDRADHIFGTAVGVLDAVWTGIQRAEVVVVDFTTRSADVALEFGWAAVLGKRMVVLTQHREDVPVDVRGDIRPLVYSMDGVGGVELMEELKQQLQEARDQVKAEKTLVTIDNDPSTALRPATVITIDGDHAVVETEERGPRRFCVLSGDDVTYNRIYRDMSKFCRVGQRLNGAIVTDFNGGIRYSLLVNEDNPWPGILASYPEGTSFRTRVDNFRDGIGAFAEVAGKVNGLILSSRDRGADLGVGTEIEVEVFRVEPENRQITLRLHRVCSAVSPLPIRTRGGQPAPRPVTGGYPAVGARLDGRVVKIVPEGEGQGGYLLVKLDGPQQWPTAMLHCTKMTSDLRHDLNHGHVDLDEEILVEVVQVDPFRRRVAVKDLPDPADEADAGRAAGESGLAAAA
jgi:small subunit ribosomal protein S1